MSDYERLVEVFEIIERRGDAVYKTKRVTTDNPRWIDADLPRTVGNIQYVSMSTSYEGETFRRKDKPVLCKWYIFAPSTVPKWPHMKNCKEVATATVEVDGEPTPFCTEHANRVILEELQQKLEDDNR
jgi:hypothetical protein